MRLRIVSILLASTALVSAATELPRFHFGDDPAWSGANFDDSSWSVASDGKWQAPPFDGSGIMWVRFRLPVPADSGPLAIRVPLESSVALPEEIWVNGRIAGTVGRFPPRPYARIVPVTTVFVLPAGSATPGQTAIVAWRVWYPPALRLHPQAGGFRFEIGSLQTLQVEERGAIAEDRLSRSADATAYVAFLLLGIALLVVWRLADGSRELALFGIFLIAAGVWSIWVRVIPSLIRPDWSWSTQIFGDFALQWITWPVALGEFLGAVYGLRTPWQARVIAVIAGIGFGLECLIYSAPASAPWVLVAAAAGSVALGTMVAAGLLVIGWQLPRSPETRGVGFTMVIWSILAVLSGGWETPYTGQEIPEAYQLLNHRVVPYLSHWRGVTTTTPDICNTLFVLAVGFLLLHRLWRTWRRTQELDAEFEAARQMQQSLVPPAAGTSGFNVASAYLPAREVGGDFFWTIPGTDGSLLLVAGDVSGKGLKAAMTVATLAGALRNEPSRKPAQVLSRLNSVLLGHGGGGFTTCCAALFKADGSVTIANAGHMPPWRNGEEIQVEPGLPLGLIAGPEYAGAVAALRPGDALTFVSDGVVEARNASREIYGFERMRALSTQPAARIAETARAFGQEDDISVITIERSAAAALAA